MNKKAILIIVSVLAIFPAFAQDYARPLSEQAPVSTNKRFRIGISIGPAIPMQDLASTNVKGSFWDITSNDSTKLQGFAQNGFHFDLTASFLITDELGIMVMIGGNSCNFNTNAFSPLLGSPTTTPSGGYYIGEYMAGPFLSIQQGKFNFNFCGMIGLVSASYPQLNLAINDTITEVVNFQGGSSFGYCFGGGIEYNINDNIAIAANVYYTGAVVKYPSWTDTYDITGYYPYTIYHSNDQTSMTLGILKPTFGIYFKM